MFVDESPDAEVRIIDFGLSQKFAANQHLHDAVGTVYVVWLTFAVIVIFEDSYHLFCVEADTEDLKFNADILWLRS